MFLNSARPYSWANGTDLMLAQLAKGPLAIVVDASNWSSYASGVFNG